MIQHHPVLNSFAIYPQQEHTSPCGILATALAHVDGVAIGPFMVLCDHNEEVHVVYCLELDSFAVPECLRSSELREYILGLVYEALSDSEAGRP